MRIGILGGTFDPVHVGHLVGAVNARHLLHLDTVLLVVANEPWQKVEARPVTPARDRLALVEAAVAGHPGIEASSLEIDRGGVSYTADTVAELAGRHPGAELFLLVGADVVSGLDTWERVDQVRSGVTLVAMSRPGTAPVDERADVLRGWRVVSIEIPALEISSTDLRERAADGRPLDFLIPEPAIRMLRARHLYAGSTMNISPSGR